MSLADMYEKIAAADQQIEEQYEDLSDVEKVAQEYDAAGRIMARGFQDELNKLAQAASGPTPGLIAQAKKGQEAREARSPAPKRQYVPSKAPTGTVNIGIPKIIRK